MNRDEAINILRERIYRYKDLEDIVGITQEDIALDFLIGQLNAAHSEFNSPSIKKRGSKQ